MNCSRSAGGICCSRSIMRARRSGSFGSNPRPPPGSALAEAASLPRSRPGPCPGLAAGRRRRARTAGRPCRRRPALAHPASAQPGSVRSDPARARRAPGRLAEPPAPACPAGPSSRRGCRQPHLPLAPRRRRSARRRLVAAAAAHALATRHPDTAAARPALQLGRHRLVEGREDLRSRAGSGRRVRDANDVALLRHLDRDVGRHARLQLELGVRHLDDRAVGDDVLHDDRLQAHLGDRAR